MIIIIKTILVMLSICTVGILPLLTLFYMWIWNNFIIDIITCATPITSFWIGMGLTAVFGGISTSIFSIFKKS